MRKRIVHPGVDEFSYEIREIVEVAKKIEQRGQKIFWENIGDPVSKGESIPEWIREIILEAIKEDSTFAYSPTKGLLEAREYIAYERNIEGGIQITPEDILFFNGLGDAISKIYSLLHQDARIIGPNPAYPTHSSAEAEHADSPHITYKLDPKNSWYPDFDDLEEKIKANESIVGILFVNPDNPTGMVYPPEILKKFVNLAKKYNLFLISDEIYSNLWYSEFEMKKLAYVIDDVPAIAMRGLSKEVPWPGARCGWIEFYNRGKDEQFDRYAKSIVDAKMLEVCSTTLPQKVLPKIMGNPKYYPYLAERNERYKKYSNIVHDELSEIPEIIVNKAKGAFYMTIVFKEGVLNEKQTLDVREDFKDIIYPLVNTEILDKRFVYYLLASKGVCVVPLSSGFNSDLFGFRMTLLEKDEKTFKKIVGLIKEGIIRYIKMF